MSAEQSASKPDVVHQQQAEGEAEQSGHESKTDTEACVFSSKEGEG